MRRITGSIAVLCGIGLLLGGAPASAQQSFPASGRQPALLEVPYLPQSELLCGGAALAMLERYWGRRGVYAEDFGSLVEPGLEGIRTTELAAAARTRGWKTLLFDGTAETVEGFLAEGVPVLVLLQVVPDRYHYVVLLGWSAGRVTFHDPARAPSRSWTESRFLAAWDGASRWALVIRPDTAALPPVAKVAPPPLSDGADGTGGSSCRPALELAFAAVATDRLAEAADLLSGAVDACPEDVRLLRELAGVRFKQRRLAESTRLAERYTALVPADSLGWQLLAASRYLAGDRDGALLAWNRVGTPTIDLLRIDGVHAIRFRVLAGSINLPHGTILTPAHLALARRRIADVPALRRATVGYQPVGGGRVEVQAAVAERPVLEPWWRLLATAGLGAVTQHEVSAAVATPSGGGELVSAAWRWEHAHPRVAVRLEVPVRLGISGTLGVDGIWERFRFSSDTAATGSVEERRRAAGLRFAAWVTPALRPSAGLRLERWSAGREYLAATAGTEIQAAGDRLSLAATVEHGFVLTGHAPYDRSRIRGLWASSTGLTRATWSIRLGADLASRRAPLGMWPVASGDLSWTIPLRAHPRTSEDLLPGATTGRVLIHGGLSGDHPLWRTGPFSFAAGLFLDGARVIDPADGSRRNRFYLDGGGGLRIGLLDGLLGTLRVDLATGLTDRRTALTVGLHEGWPPFRPSDH